MTIEETLEDPAALRELCEQIAAGEREPQPELLTAAVRRAAAARGIRAALPWLDVVREIKRAEEAALRRMTPAERMNRYRKGRITRHQAQFWELRYPEEIPRIDGIPEWEARYLVDTAEARRSRR
jgi:hypothetical protein